ncbi:rhamnogalacturonan acetylesterase [Paenibacillus sp. Marseille-Q4541]|uniref:rhamnogalacturonan acetylesterase n=1 Tax=Paenibacillus sp. Marseille-Q4541 TaxID=2831522 RepID=UPI001BA602F2|nr:rhamnogalacturonan acetylesterase [Paenibacillus sp. Marseille-Q4541]
MNHYKFDFGPGIVAEGYTKVLPDTLYSAETGYGFESIHSVYGRDRSHERIESIVSSSKVSSVRTQLQDRFCIPLNAVFVLDVPQGTYRVHALMGDENTESRTSIRAGEGRLMLPPVHTHPGQWIEEQFSVVVREGESLKLSFSGAAPRINALEIMEAGSTLTVYIAGDSTVCDQPTSGYPYAGWGQMLPAFFKHDVAVDNHAYSGRSTKSFIEEGRLDAILSRVKSGDFLFIQFGHNDEKSDALRGTKAFTTYQEYLSKYIHAAREREVHPVLITPVHRRYFQEDGSLMDTHGDYIVAMKELADQEKVPLIDLAAQSKILFEEAGVEGSKLDFLWAWPGEYVHFPAGVEDNTHFSQRGARRMAKIVATSISELAIHPLSMFLRS